MLKKILGDLTENKEVTLPITYSFFKNDLVFDVIENDINVKEGEQKILFLNVKGGYVPLSNILIVDHDEVTK